MGIKLIDLEPQWLERDGTRAGFMFRCPHCRTEWLTCFRKKMRIFGDEVDKPWRWTGQMGYIREALDRIGLLDQMENAVVPCEFDTVWKFSGDGFHNLSVTPSINAEKSGHWHGHITNGEIA